MYAEKPRSGATLKNLNFLCDVQFILGLPCILLMVECVHALVKLAQSKDVFMCDFVEFVKLAQHELYWFIVIFMPNMKIWHLMSLFQSKL
jgi:hypothetical protein